MIVGIFNGFTGKGYPMWPLLLLVGSNVFMTIAWYGHLRFKGLPFWSVILISWLIALPEYALQVPANRLLYGKFSATQLKIFTEAISITAFIVFGYFVLNETPSWRTSLAFLLIFAAVALAASDSRHQNEAKADIPVIIQPDSSPGGD